MNSTTNYLTTTTTILESSTWTTYWFMLPVALFVSVFANLFGVGGAVFYSPIFVVVFPLIGVPTLLPADAFGSAIATVVVGFGSGTAAYAFRKLIDYPIVVFSSAFSVPFAILGAALRKIIPSYAALFAFAGVIVVLTICRIVYRVRLNKRLHETSDTIYIDWQNALEDLAEDTSDSLTVQKKCTSIINFVTKDRTYRDADSSISRYSVVRLKLLIAASIIGGLFVGFVSVGAGELIVTALNCQQRIPFKIASGTSIAIVLITTIAATIHDAISNGIMSFPWKLLVWTMPAVFVGAQLGSFIASRVKKGTILENILTGLFVLIAIVMFVQACLMML